MPFDPIQKKYVNPFYQQVSAPVQNELNTRAAYYGRRVRSAGESVPKNLLWSYQKVAWGHVIGSGIKLGFPGSKVMSDKDGNLTLYSAQRNVPKKPLLTGIEISNEGTMGSLLKGKFTFTVFPVLTSNGFDLGSLEKAFFTPGKEVEISWGWSVAAHNQESCAQQFSGIIYNFNWTFNNDMSITADVSVVSAASIAMGQSGDQSVLKKDEGQTGTDPAGKALNPGQNLIKVIDNDLAQLTGSNVLTKGQARYIEPSKTVSKYLDYVAIGLPFQESADNQTTAQQKTAPVDKTFWYVSLGRVAEFAQRLISGTPFEKIYTIQCADNETDYNKDVKSAYPIDVYFPDNEMGKYGDLNPFPGEESSLRTFFTEGGKVKPDVINIGGILLGVDYVKKTYEEFVVDNATNIPFKNITNFFDTLIKKINVASGDIYQLTPQMYEPRQPGGKIDSTQLKIGEPGAPKAILSIEDSNLAKSHTDKVTPYKFEGTIFKPLIKSVQLSSKPPGPLATAAFVQARSGDDGKKSPPNNADVNTTRKEEKNDEFEMEYTNTVTEIENQLKNAYASGFNDAWSEGYRANLVKVKKLKTGPTDGNNGAHFLNQAIYPVDFSITIDGVAGFKFGDVITTTLIPKKYYETYKMVFTVTKITHSIKDGMWETTLNTKSRIRMDGTENQQKMG